MVAVICMQPAIRKYLELFELELKKRSGIVPEDALSDAREFLMSDANALLRSGEPPSEEEHFQWILDNYGSPDVVAQQYGDCSNAVPAKMGYAPGWRICCTKCGRSAPLAAIGAIRIGAKSWHKYTLGFCYGCNRLRFMRIIQDLDQYNLTERLGVTQLPEQVRSSMHRPITTIVGILASVALIIFFAATIALCIVYIVMRTKTPNKRFNLEPAIPVLCRNDDCSRFA